MFGIFKSLYNLYGISYFTFVNPIRDSHELSVSFYMALSLQLLLASLKVVMLYCQWDAMVQLNVAKRKQFDINLVECERVVPDGDKRQQKGSMIR